MKIYYIRHGEPTYDKNDSLTENGIYQVNEISKYLCKIPFDLAFTSPLRRTKLTAEPTLNKIKLESKELDWASEDFAWFRLNERYLDRDRWLFEIPKYLEIFKKYESLSNKEFFKDPVIKNTNFKLIQKTVDKGVDKWIKSLGFKHDRKKKIYKAINIENKNVILFAHQGISTFIFSSLLDQSYSNFRLHYPLLDCASISIFDINEVSGKIKLEAFNLIKY